MKQISFLLACIFLLFSCDNSKISPNAGGTFRMALDADLATTTPRFVTDYYTATVLNQIYEGLVSLDPEHLKIRGQLAESYKVSADGLLYEFTIRKNVLFHPHAAFDSEAERTLTCDDVVHSFELACKRNDKGLPSPAFTSIFQKSIVGANAFYEGKAKSIKGITFKNNVLSIRLLLQDVNFLNKLTGINAAISSKKVYQVTGDKDMIGTGPFKFSAIENTDHKKIILLKNAQYYLKDKDGCNLPYLDQIEFLIETNKLNQLALFDADDIDLITSLPTTKIKSILEDRIQDFNGVPPVLLLKNNPLLVTNYYFFNMQDARFKDPRVRQAFNYAVSRNRITQDVLLRQAFENGNYGLVPPIPSTFQTYDFEGIKAVGYHFDPEKAKSLLAEAGYPGGKDFGTVTLKFSIGDINSKVAEEFASQIYKTLGINVNIDGASFEQTTQDADYLKGDIFRTAWSADYGSPETFLQNFYGKLVPSASNLPSTINQSRYINPAFDAYFEKAKGEKKVSMQLKYFNLAEKELLKDPPVIVLWYAGDNQLLYAKVRNLHYNPMNYFYFRDVYIKEWTKEEYQDNLMK